MCDALVSALCLSFPHGAKMRMGRGAGEQCQQAAPWVLPHILWASCTPCLSILPQFITKFLKYYIFYYIQTHFIAFDNTDNHIPYALMF